MDLTCQTDTRREAVRSLEGRNGLDYIEVGDDQCTLYVYFLGKLPPELSRNGPGLEQYLQIAGGDSITGINVVRVDAERNSDPERDDCLIVTVDKPGDFSVYTLSLSGVAGIDPFYASVPFSFKVGCPSDLDCTPSCECRQPLLDEPRISYLAKDYASFRQLILDRLALLSPDWAERHVPDLGLTLVEVLAYVGDHLSYYQDAVATEAYLGTARQRISVRRHVRLVDYRLHEGCNARAWVHLDVSEDLALPPAGVAFVSGGNAARPLQQNVLGTDQLASVPSSAYEYFEPLLADMTLPVQLRQAHNQICFYTWGQRECCLMQGATAATLLDRWVVPAPTADQPTVGTTGTVASEARLPRALGLQAGDVLIFEEVLGPKTGVSADADPQRRWAVRLTSVQPAEDSVFPLEVAVGETSLVLPTPVVCIKWATEDALPFSFCLSTLSAAPNCAYLPDVSVVRGNNILVDHGRTQEPESLGPVPGVTGASCCECEGQPSDVQSRPALYRPTLRQLPLTYLDRLRQPAPPASQTLVQDSREAVGALSLVDDTGSTWTVQRDLIASGPDDRDLVVEIDNDRVAHLRFGNGELGREPDVGSRFTAVYRVGCGTAGNVGAEAISRLVLKGWLPGGVSITVRNPLPAQGGVDPEPIDQAKQFAPAAFRRRLERAITADDYATLAQANPKLERASAQLNWTGSWYEADVSVDPWNLEMADPALLEAIGCDLERYRRMGHDLRVQAAVYVPIKLGIEACALPGYDRGHVKAALLARFSNRSNADGTQGFFHPDRLSFGDWVYLSRIIAAAQAVVGVSCVTVTEFHRLFEPPNQEIADGVVPLAGNEIAQLDNDPNHPERGQLQIVVGGGR